MNKILRYLLHYLNLSYHKTEYPVVIEAVVYIDINENLRKSVVISYPYNSNHDLKTNIVFCGFNVKDFISNIKNLKNEYNIKTNNWTYRVVTSFGNLYLVDDNTDLDIMLNNAKRVEKLRSLLMLRKFKNRIKCSACVLNIGDNFGLLTYGRRHDVAAQAALDFVELFGNPEYKLTMGFATHYYDINCYSFHTRKEASKIAYDNLQYWYKAEYEKGENLISECLYYDGSI